MKRIVTAVAFWLAATAAALCQVPQYPQQLPQNSVVGRLGIGPGPSQAIPFNLLAAQIGGTPATRNINTTAPLAGGGNLSADRTLSIGANGISNALIRQSGALALVGNATNATANVADIAAVANSSCVFVENASTLTCGQVATAGLANNAVTNAKAAQMAAYTIKGNPTGSLANATDFTIDGLTNKASPAAGDEVLIWDVAGAAIKKASVSGIGTSAGVSSLNSLTGALSIVAGTGIGVTPSGSNITVAINNPAATNSLGADVLLNNTANYFDGPSVAQGTSGTWFASGTVTLTDTANNVIFTCKLWDGTTVIASVTTQNAAANFQTSASLSGFIASPAANIRISCRDNSLTTGKMLFNSSVNSKDSTITAFRIQ